jgi:type IV pilus assembly protein PilP
MRALLIGLVAVVVTPTMCAAQAAAAPAKPAQPAAPVAGATPAKATGATAVLPLETPGYAYDPEGRRDPFTSLLNRGASGAATPSARAAGLGGLGVGETTLKGTLASRSGFVAILQGSDAKTYIVHPGEKLADGTIRSISSDAVVFLQQVNDPLSREKQREVRKVLRQMEEAK